MAIAIAKYIPNLTSALVATKVTIPSGTLCIIIASIDINPSLNKVLSPLILLLSGIYFPVKYAITIPNNVNNITIIILLKNKNSLFKNLILSGIKSKIETPAITPEAKASAK